jgi:hypothetical protein
VPGVATLENLDSQFPGDIQQALGEIRELSRAIIESICGSEARAKDVSDRFGLHAKLGWQIWHVANSEPLAGYRFLPNPHGLAIWRRAGEAQGVPADLFERLEVAVKLLADSVALHAGDEAMFDMLVDSQAEASSEDAEIKWRKQAFLGNAFTFGVRAKCLLNTGILFPDARLQTFSIVRLTGLIDFVRTRSGVRWPISNTIVQHYDGSEPTIKREALYPQEGGTPVPFLTPYCTKPLPQIERRSDGERVYDELLAGAVGLTGASTVYIGEILHEIGPTYGSTENEAAHFGSGIRTPAELLISDHIVHKSLFPNVERELRVYSELISPMAHDDVDRLSVSEQLQFLGHGLHRTRTADVPRYAEILMDAFQRIGFDPNDFAVYRIRMKYPPIPTSAMVWHLLPARQI